MARLVRDAPVPTLQQIRRVIAVMPSVSDIEQRDRALIAFTSLTGARDGAIASLKLKHLDLTQGMVMQDTREVHTKFNKTFPTWFFPVGEDIRWIVEEWVRHLRETLLWSPDDPLFPATLVAQGEDRRFRPAGLARRHWANATPIRTIFREAFTLAGLIYFNPHSFRKTLAQLGEQKCQTPEQFKAWSQNLGHERVMTTFASYGAVSVSRQAEIIRSLALEAEPDERVKEVARQLMRLGAGSRGPITS